MSKVKIEKDGVTQEVKSRYLHNFLSQGWQEVGSVKKKVSKIGNAKATADVIEEDAPQEDGEDNWTFSLDETSMPNTNEGEE